jgi:hypothetical protein
MILMTWTDEKEYSTVGRETGGSEECGGCAVGVKGTCSYMVVGPLTQP